MLEQSQDFKSPLIYTCMYVCIYVYIYFFSPPPGLWRGLGVEKIYSENREEAPQQPWGLLHSGLLCGILCFSFCPPRHPHGHPGIPWPSQTSPIFQRHWLMFSEMCPAMLSCKLFNCCPLQPGFSVFQLLFKNQFFCLIIYSLLKLSRLQMKESLHPRRLTYFGCVVGVQDIFLELLKVLRI